MVRIALLVASLVVALAVASGPASVAVAARPRCRAGYKVQRKRGVWRCVLQPREPRPPRDAVTPSRIELIVAKVERGRFGATGWMEFSERVTGTAYGNWVISNGTTRERLPFRLPGLTRTDYTPFTIGYPIATHIRGRTITATLVIDRVRSNSLVVKQPELTAASARHHGSWPPPLAIAVEAPISGPQSSNGVDILRGVKLAVRQANAQGGVLGRRVVLVQGDDRGEASRAEATARSVIARRPVAVIGPYNSSVGLANLSLYRRARVLPLWMTSSDDTAGAGITLQPMNSQIAPVEAEYVQDQGWRRVAMLVDDTADGAFTRGMATRLRARLQAAGVAVTWISVQERGGVPDGYYAEKVAEALAGGPDLVYSSTYYPEGAEIAKALQAAGGSPACLMGLANVDPGFVGAAGLAAAKRCVYSGVPKAQQLPFARRFVRQYRAAFGAPTGVWGVFGYDSAKLLFSAIRRTGSTGYAALQQSLRAVRDVDGQTGPISIARRTGYRATLEFLGIMRVDDAGEFVLIR